MSEKPEPPLKDKIVGFIILGALGYGAWLYFKPATLTSEQVAAAALAAEQAETDCRQSLQCWGDRHAIAASVRCDDQIERLAQYSAEWTDGILEPKFSHFRWSPLGTGIVVYIGDKVRFQNGFGAWQNMIYECTYNPETEQALAASAQPGRL